MSNPCRVVVLISGSGSNLQALIDGQKAGDLAISIKAVISNRPNVMGLTRAKNAGISTVTLDHKHFGSREAFDEELAASIDRYQPDLIVLAGFMRILTPEFVRRYQGKMLNIHPSLLPKFQGLHTHKRALEANDSIHGVTVHFVTEELDGGPPVIQAVVPVFENDTEDTLAKRVQMQEHKIYPKAVDWFASGRLHMVNGKAILDDDELPPCGEQIRQI